MTETGPTDTSVDKHRDRPLALPTRLGGRLFGFGLMLLVLPVLYWGLYPWLFIHAIDDDTAFAPTEVPDGGSAAVAAAAALIDREINVHEWVANNPIIDSAYFLDNMTNFQLGIVDALSRFAVEMRDQVGRERGTSQADNDLADAAGKLALPGTTWWYDTDVSYISVQTTSEQQYLAARRSLLSYNERLAAGNAVFERRSDNFLATLERFASALGAASANTDEALRDASIWILEGRADDIFYANKGRIYGYHVLLRGLGEDYSRVLRDRQLEAVWRKLLDGLRQAAELQPWFILNAPLDGMVLPNHLAAQGFYLVRARTQLKEVTNILLK